MSVLRTLALAFGVAALAGTAHGEEPPPAWAFSTSLYGYDVPESQDYLNLNFTADYERLHVEARYQYESIDTESVWVGANFHAGTKWVFDATAMLGGVFGDLEGIAPGYRLSLTRSWFSLASEGEYFFDTHDHEGNYFYSWTEVAGSPVEWFRAGLVGQRTRAYASELDIQRGIFAGFTYKKLDVAAYVFNLGWEDPTYVLSVRVDF
jgi:hypothetical protein